MSLEDKFLQLSTPSTRIKFGDLEKNKPYDIRKLTLLQHKSYGDSIICEIAVNNKVRSVFLPKRFSTLAPEIHQVNSEIEQGKIWMLKWEGPTADKFSNLVKMYSVKK